MKTLQESILDPDFFDRELPLDIVIAFMNSFHKFVPSPNASDAEKLEYWFAIFNPVQYLLNRIGEQNDANTNQNRLRMIEYMFKVVDFIVSWDEENQKITIESKRNSKEAEWFMDLITCHYKDIENNEFKPWTSNWSSGYLMVSLFGEECTGSGVSIVDEYRQNNPWLKDFNEVRCERMSKKMLSTAQRYSSRLK